LEQTAVSTILPIGPPLLKETVARADRNANSHVHFPPGSGWFVAMFVLSTSRCSAPALSFSPRPQGSTPPA
jgi:hypothetical protein